MLYSLRGHLYSNAIVCQRCTKHHDSACAFAEQCRAELSIQRGATANNGSFVRSRSGADSHRTSTRSQNFPCHTRTLSHHSSWSFGGYGQAVARLAATIQVLTAGSTVRALEHGYPVDIHSSA